MDWQPKAGEYARTRDGRKAFVAFNVPANPFSSESYRHQFGGFVTDVNDLIGWTSDGLLDSGKTHDRDLVGPWIEPVDVPVTVRLFENGSRSVGIGHIADGGIGSGCVGYKHVTVRVQPGDRG